MGTDRELRDLIRGWSPPPPSPDLNHRMLSRYRSTRGGRVAWKRFLHARLPVPVPLIMAGLVFAGVVILLYLRNLDDPRERLSGFEPVASPRMIVTSMEATK